MQALKNKVAVITGASSGIGRALSISLAEKGMKLFLLGRNENALKEVADQTRENSPQVTCCCVDLLVDADIQKTVDYLLHEAGTIDILVHSAGIFSAGSLEEAPVSDFDKLFTVNVRAPYLLTQAFIEKLRLQQGQVVFINSRAGLGSRANIGQYAATKFALKAIADSFRKEVESDGIRVISVFLGRTATPMQAEIFAKEGREYTPEQLIQPADVAEVITTALLLPRTAEVTEIVIKHSSTVNGKRQN